MDADSFKREIDDIIGRTGWAVIHVVPREGEDDSPYTYTVGLAARGWPELAVSGFRQELAIAVLNDVAGQMMNGAVFEPGQRIGEVIEGFGLIVVDGTDQAGPDTIWPGAALERYGPGIRLHQLVWPDMGGHYPWDDEYGLPDHEQIVLATPGDR